MPALLQDLCRHGLCLGRKSGLQPSYLCIWGMNLSCAICISDTPSLNLKTHSSLLAAAFTIQAHLFSCPTQHSLNKPFCYRGLDTRNTTQHNQRCNNDQKDVDGSYPEIVRSVLKLVCVFDEVVALSKGPRHLRWKKIGEHLV